MRSFFPIALAAVAAVILLPGPARAATLPNPWLVAARTDEPVLTPAQMLDRAHEAIKAIEAVVAEVKKRLDEAKDEKDLLLQNCLGELHSQARALLKAGHDTVEALEEAVEANDSDGTARLYARMEATRKRAEKIRQDANECVGAAEAGGKSGADLLARPDLEDPTDPRDPIPPMVRPPPTSPTT